MGKINLDPENREIIPVSPTIIIDLEDFLLAKSGILKLTRSEISELPMRTIYHFLGFIKGQEEMERMKQKTLLKQKNFQDFLRGG